MTDTKAQELSHDEWHELLEPYGWTGITTRSVPTWRGYSPGILEWEIRVMLKGSPGGEAGEWAEPSYLPDQARQAVHALPGNAYALPAPPPPAFPPRHLNHPT